MQLLAILLCALGAIVAAGQSTPNGGDEQAIRELARQYMNARNTKDVEATRNLFTPDADQLVSSGEWRKGLDALVKGAMASSQKENGSSTLAVESVRFVSADVAIADARYETTSTAGAVRKMWSTLIVKRTAAGWHIAAIRNMLPAPSVTAH